MPGLNAAIQRYLVFNYALSARTKTIYRSHLERLCLALDDPPVDQIDHHVLAGFLDGLRKCNGQKYSPGTVDQIHRTMHSFFEFCVGERWLSANPMDRLKHPKPQAGPKPRLSLAQIKRLIHAVHLTEAGERNLAIILLMVDCGLRSGEVVNLRAGDVFIEEKRIYVRSNKIHACRDVPLNDLAVAALQKYLERRQRPIATADEPFFLIVKGPKKSQGLTRKAIEELMKRLKRKLKFNLHAHLLRHTFGNHYIRRGNLRYLQKIMGHSRIDTTARFYTDPDFPDIQEEHRQASPTAQIWRENGRE